MTTLEWLPYLNMHLVINVNLSGHETGLFLEKRVNTIADDDLDKKGQPQLR